MRFVNVIAAIAFLAPASALANSDSREAAHRFANWSSPGVHRAAVLTAHEANFYCEPHRAGDPPRRCYLVKYSIDAASPGAANRVVDRHVWLAPG
jgi:hypothetical protein